MIKKELVFIGAHYSNSCFEHAQSTKCIQTLSRAEMAGPETVALTVPFPRHTRFHTHCHPALPIHVTSPSILSASAPWFQGTFILLFHLHIDIMILNGTLADGESETGRGYSFLIVSLLSLLPVVLGDDFLFLLLHI